MKYTYDDFTKAMTANGLTFSDADMKLAQQNPDAGMGILNYKIDYKNATTPEQRALANQGAENIRSSYGNYTGGTDGSMFHLNPLSPDSFSYGPAPEYDSKYAGQIADALAAQQSFGDFSYEAAPQYNNRYDAQINDLLNQIVNREQFSYDAATDPLYAQYSKAYEREGQRATADALGQAAAASGGIPSSYAQTAASQAANYYAAQKADKIPELYQLAYNQYLQEYQLKQSDLAAVQGAEQSDWAKYQTQLGQYNQDRAFDYAAYLDQYQRAQDNLSALVALDQNDLDLYKTKLGQYNTDRAFGYQNLLDEITQQQAERDDVVNRAQMAAAYGDYRPLNELGVDTSNNQTDYERRVQMAQLAASMGDFSRMRELGIDTSQQEYEQQLDRAQLAASVGDYSLLRALGINPAEEPAGPVGGDDEPVPAGGLSQADIDALIASYGKEIPQADWDALIASNPGLTAEGLTAAGFSIKGSEDESKEEAKRPGEEMKITNRQAGGGIYMPGTNERVTWDELLKMVESGKVIEEVKNGTVYYRYANKK